MTIKNGSSLPLGAATLPNVSGALGGLLQPVTFVKIVKTVVDFKVVETRTEIAGRGVIQPFNDRQLQLKPEGQRAWTWLQMHADASLALDVDDVVTYAGKPTRVMSVKDFGVYGYLEYQLVQDYTEAGA